MMVKDEQYTLLIKLLLVLFHMMVNDEHYTLLIKLLCAAVPYAVPYDGQDEHCILLS